MYEIARKFFLPILLGSVLAFAIGEMEVSAASRAANFGGSVSKSSLNDLDDSDFWGKFRESVMKDRDRNEPGASEQGDPARGGGDFGGDGHGNGGPGGRGGDGPGGRGR